MENGYFLNTIVNGKHFLCYYFYHLYAGAMHESVMTDHITKTGRDSLTEQTSKQTHSPMNKQQI